MKKVEYSKKGICIWCLKSKPEIMFKTKPHTIPKSLNSENIGFDICDSCNSYFGTDDKLNKVTYSIDKIVKEFFNVHKFLLNNKKDSNSWKTFKSQFFSYYHQSQKLKINVDYIRNPQYANELTRKFTRGIYNIFLQEFHRNTELGLDNEFDMIRNFVRYNIGEVSIYYLVSNKGLRISEDLSLPFELTFNKNVLRTIKEYGIYHFSMTGLNFFLEVTGKAKSNQEFLINEANNLIGSGFVFKRLVKLTRIDQIDFTLQKWHLPY